MKLKSLIMLQVNSIEDGYELVCWGNKKRTFFSGRAGKNQFGQQLRTM